VAVTDAVDIGAQDNCTERPHQKAGAEGHVNGKDANQ
jgi:hypothetical protein